MTTRMRTTLGSAATTIAALLALSLGARTAQAAEETRGYDLIDMDEVNESTHAGVQRYVAVGCDGTYPAKTARMQVVSPATGALLWEDTIPSPNACLWTVLATSDVVYTSGYVADEDDNGDNLVVQAHRAKGGALLWRKEFEAPNPKQDVIKRLNSNEDLALLNGKLLVWMTTTGDANPTVLLRLDAKTGTLLATGSD